MKPLLNIPPEGSEKYLIEEDTLIEAIKVWVISQADVFEAADFIGRKANEIAEKESMVKRQLLEIHGVPDWILSKVPTGLNPTIVDKAKTDILSKFLVSSSNTCRYSPMSGENRSEDDYSIYNYMMKEKLGGNHEQVAAEAEFISYLKSIKPGEEPKKNNSSYMNPAVPYLIATPDGVVKKGAVTIIASIEVKIITSKKTFSDFAKDSLVDKNIGIKILVEADGSFSATLRKGHPWRAQILTQLLALRVEKAYLGVKVAGRWVLVEEKRDRETLATVAKNVFSTHLRVLSQYATTISNDYEPWKTNVGRPKKNVKADTVKTSFLEDWGYKGLKNNQNDVDGDFSRRERSRSKETKASFNSFS